MFFTLKRRWSTHVQSRKLVTDEKKRKKTSQSCRKILKTKYDNFETKKNE